MGHEPGSLVSTRYMVQNRQGGHGVWARARHCGVKVRAAPVSLREIRLPEAKLRAGQRPGPLLGKGQQFGAPIKARVAPAPALLMQKMKQPGVAASQVEHVESWSQVR